MFRIWSKTNQKAIKELKPDLGLRSWDKLSKDEKEKIWEHLWRRWFFDKSNIYTNNNKIAAKSFYSYAEYKTDQDKERMDKIKRISFVLDRLNDKYKLKTYARDFLNDRTISTAMRDFYSIYINESEDVVFELLSIYAARIIFERDGGLPKYKKKDGETQKGFLERSKRWEWEIFDKFATDLNDIFEHFGIYVYLTRSGLIPYQDKKIIEDIYTPVMNVLLDKRYEPISIALRKSFTSFSKKDFNKTIQNAINAMHAYLQIELGYKVGSGGNFKKLLNEAIKKEKIPHTNLLSRLYSDIESFLAKERGEKTDAHPSTGNPTIHDALFILNITMVMLQSFLSDKK